MNDAGIVAKTFGVNLVHLELIYPYPPVPDVCDPRVIAVHGFQPYRLMIEFQSFRSHCCHQRIRDPFVNCSFALPTLAPPVAPISPNDNSVPIVALPSQDGVQQPPAGDSMLPTVATLITADASENDNNQRPLMTNEELIGAKNGRLHPYIPHFKSSTLSSVERWPAAGQAFDPAALQNNNDNLQFQKR